MKKIMLLLILISILGFVLSCNNEQTKNKSTNKTSIISYEISPNNKDTVNVTDGSGFKQGHWIITKYAVLNKNNGAERIKVEEGVYKNNKREGFWKKFSESGQLIDSVNYENDKVIAK